MSKVFYAGNVESEQAVGVTPRSEYVEIYAVRTTNPTVLNSLGGHRFDDAPTYNKSEAKRSNIYTKNGGRNVVKEQVVGGEYTKSVDFTLQMPMRVRSVTDIIYSEQEKNGASFDIAFIPTECLEGCDQYFIVGQDAYFGSKDWTSTLVGYDENGNPYTSQRQITTTGELLTYEGLEQRTLTVQGAATALLDIHAYSVPCASGENCINQNLIRTGGAIAEYSNDGGATWTAITTTTITADLVGALITSVIRSGNNFVFGYSDVAGGLGTDGGLAYSVDGAATVLSTFSSGSSAGVQVVIKAFNKIYAFGTSGEGWVSCDNGLSFDPVTTGISGNIYSAAFDDVTQLLYIGAAAGEAWVFDGELFTEISTEVGAGAADLTAVAVLAPKKVAFGDNAGILYENYTADDLDSTYGQTAVLSGSTISFIAGDGVGAYRTVVGVASSVYMRDLYSDQTFELLGTVSGNVGGGDAGESIINYAGGYYTVVTSDGNTYKFENCSTCLDDGSC